MTATGFRWQAPALIRVALLINCAAIAGGAEISGGWDFRSKGDGWQTRSRVMPTCNGLIQALVVEFPWSHRAEEGDFGALVRPIELCGNEGAKLSFTWSDNFAGPTAGCHFAQVTLDGRVVWEADVAGKTPEARVSLDLPQASGPARAGNATSELGLRVAVKKTVTNFGVAVRWSNILLEVPGRPAVAIASEVQLAPADAIPNELPLPSVGPTPTEWHRQAIVLQPWGKTQHAALTDVEGRPRRLRDEHRREHHPRQRLAGNRRGGNQAVFWIACLTKRRTSPPLFHSFAIWTYPQKAVRIRCKRTTHRPR